jgi:hypothetical protein
MKVVVESLVLIEIYRIAKVDIVCNNAVTQFEELED